MEIDQSFFKEEIRSGFLVTEKRKKIWYTELLLLQAFDEFCRRHGLIYFVDYGTLLGAVRHKGFIPWDDDIDVVMFRDDYAKLLAIAPEEFQEPYHFQNTYNCPILWAFSKLRDSRTAAIEYTDMPDMNQGIFIDIFPLDDVPDHKNFSSNILTMQYDLWLALSYPELIIKHQSQGMSFSIPDDLLAELLNLSTQERLQQFESFNLSQFGRSEKVNLITEEIYSLSKSRKREWFSDVVYLPFEYISVPAPIGFEEVLTCQYGNYKEPVQNGSAHEGIFIDPDLPYSYYMEHPEKLP